MARNQFPPCWARWGHGGQLSVTITRLGRALMSAPSVSGLILPSTPHHLPKWSRVPASSGSALSDLSDQLWSADDPWRPLGRRFRSGNSHDFGGPGVRGLHTCHTPHSMYITSASAVQSDRRNYHAATSQPTSSLPLPTTRGQTLPTEPRRPRPPSSAVSATSQARAVRTKAVVSILFRPLSNEFSEGGAYSSPSY